MKTLFFSKQQIISFELLMPATSSHKEPFSVSSIDVFTRKSFISASSKLNTSSDIYSTTYSFMWLKLPRYSFILLLLLIESAVRLSAAIHPSVNCTSLLTSLSFKRSFIVQVKNSDTSELVSLRSLVFSSKRSP